MKLACHPSLGEPSFSIEDVAVSVVVEAAQRIVRAAVWHDAGGRHDWQELVLDSSPVERLVLILPESAEEPLYCFRGTLQKYRGTVRFTFKILDENGDWHWAHDITGLSDGSIFYQHDIRARWDRHGLMANLNPAIHVSLAESWGSHAAGWILRYASEPNPEHLSKFQEVYLGLPNHSIRWFALVRESRPWLAPRQGKLPVDIDKDAILLSLLREDGMHFIFLAVSYDGLDVVFRSRGGEIGLAIRNDTGERRDAIVIAAIGHDFEKTLKNVMILARKYLGVPAAPEAGTEPSDWLDGLTYCTWNSLGQDLTREKLLDALEDLGSNDVKVSNIIIDDNWQSLDDFGNSPHQHRWMRFEADPQAFPGGLKGLTQSIRQLYPHIKHIAVWHGVLGYWNGVSPEGEIACQYRTRVVEKVEGDFLGGGSLTIVEAASCNELYDDFYRFLAESGVDSVKVDTQYLLDALSSRNDRLDCITPYIKAWQAAANKNLGGRAVSCMSQFPQSLFSFTFVKEEILRNSDDYFPEVADSHGWHIFRNSHNALLTRHLGSVPDWDMFQSTGDYGGIHAAARCLSGGPICITDYPTVHNPDILRQLYAVTPSKQRILRPAPGRSTNVYRSWGEPRLLRIASQVSIAETSIAYLGLFNLTNRNVAELIQLDDFPGINVDSSYVLRAHRSGTVSRPVSVSERSEVFVDLSPISYDVISASPVLQAAHGDHLVSFAFLGLCGKITGATAARSISLERSHQGQPALKIILKALGNACFYISTYGNTESLTIRMCGVDIPDDCWRHTANSIVTVDMETAWARLNPEAHWEENTPLEIIV